MSLRQKLALFGSISELQDGNLIGCRRFVAELVRLKVDVIVAGGSGAILKTFPRLLRLGVEQSTKHKEHGLSARHGTRDDGMVLLSDMIFPGGITLTEIGIGSVFLHRIKAPGSSKRNAAAQRNSEEIYY